MTPCLLAVAPNGARRTHEDHPGVPVNTAAIAQTAKACLDAGACMLHLHVRDGNGAHSLDPGTYAEATDAVRKAVGDELVIQITTESAGRYRSDEQMDVVRELVPQAASIALRELIPAEEDERPAKLFLDWLSKAGVAVQYIVYGPEEVLRFNALRKSGVVPSSNAFLLFVLGNYAQRLDGRPEQIDTFVRHIHPADPWAVCAFGPHEAQCVARAAQLGGHARVGFENNLWLPDGTLAGDNRDLVLAARQAIEAQGHRLANSREARALLGIEHH